MNKGYKNLKLVNIFKYDTEEYNFRKIISNSLKDQNLENLHKEFDFYLLERNKDQSTQFHKNFYKNYDLNGFKELYEKFIKEFCCLLMDAKLVYQAKPTFRVHMPNNLGVGEFHKDSDYNHPLEEINLLVPVTEAKDTSTIWIESAPNLGDYKPINLQYGEILVFRGGLLKHGNKINETKKTRVSFDFRVIPEQEFKPNTYASINTGMKFEIGSYYSIVGEK